MEKFLREMPKLDRRQIEEADRQKQTREPEKDGKTDFMAAFSQKYCISWVISFISPSVGTVGGCAALMTLNVFAELERRRRIRGLLC